MLVVSTAPDQLRGREHLGIGDAQSGVQRVDSRTKHDKVLPNQRRSSLILRLRSSSAILKTPVAMLKTRFPSLYPEIQESDTDSPSRGAAILLGVLIQKLQDIHS
jgi:hypothetical protein